MSDSNDGTQSSNVTTSANEEVVSQCSTNFNNTPSTILEVAHNTGNLRTLRSTENVQNITDLENNSNNVTTVHENIFDSAREPECSVNSNNGSDKIDPPKCQTSLPSASSSNQRQPNTNDVIVGNRDDRLASGSLAERNAVAISETYRCDRAITGHVESDVEVNITPPAIFSRVQLSQPPLSGAPPSYSTVMRLGPVDPPMYRQPPNIRIQPSPPFIAPPPPPSYAQVQGIECERPVIVSSVSSSFAVDRMMWGPDPLSVICPRCAAVIITSTHSHRSNLTHFSALALCLCGCWPCCLLPYCMDSCKNTYHNCPNCLQYLGMYRPF